MEFQEHMKGAARCKALAYLSDWGWRLLDDAFVQSPEGVLRLDFDSQCTVQRCLVRAWQRELMAGNKPFCYSIHGIVDGPGPLSTL